MLCRVENCFSMLLYQRVGRQL